MNFRTKLVDITPDLITIGKPGLLGNNTIELYFVLKQRLFAVYAEEQGEWPRILRAFAGETRIKFERGIRVALISGPSAGKLIV